MHEILIIILLILANGALAMAEVALITAKRSHLEGEIKNGNKSAKVALKLTENPDKFLSTVQIGITVIGIITGIYSGSLLADQFSEVLIGLGLTTVYAHEIAQTIIVIVVTYFTLIFGELVPKRVGMNSTTKAAKLVAKPMYFLSLIASPFVYILTKSTKLVFKITGLSQNTERVTEEEIKSMIKEGAKGGDVQEVEQDIVERVFLLGDLKVSSLMTHRSDIIAIDVDMNNDELKEVLENNLYEVYPVIDQSFDNVKGVVMLKNLIFKIGREDFDIYSNIEEAIFFHENMSVYNALGRMKELRVSYALIYDEFGSCQGIITLKDILGGLVGTIEDTHSEPDIIKRTDGEGWLIDGQCTIYDFLTYFEKEDLYDSDEEYNTVGGLVLNQLQDIPDSGESVIWKNFKFEVVDMDRARIDKILVTIIDDENLIDE